MSKTTKMIITIAVFILVILYFIVACEGPIKTDSSLACKKFDNQLTLKAAEYFADNLPQNYEIRSASINELIMGGFISLSDLEEIGTTCGGKVSVTNISGKYYYSNDVTCGTCSTSSLYADWTDWNEDLPNIVGTKMQVEFIKYYNYGTSDAKYSNWSDWALDSTKISEPTLPSNVEVIDTETEEKTQYSYRDGAFKWYKVSSNATYYGGDNAYYATAPANGYSKLESSKKVIETTSAYSSEAALKSALSGKTYDVVTVNGYQTGTPRYSYSKAVTPEKECITTSPLYKCYTNVQTGTNYTCSQQIESQSCIYDSSSTAVTACQTAGGSNCEAVGCAASLWTYHFEFSFIKNGILYDDCTLEAKTATNYSLSTCEISTVFKDLLTNSQYGYNAGGVSIHNCKWNSKNGFLTKYIYYNSSSSATNYVNLKGGTIDTCYTNYNWARAETAYEKYSYKYINYLYNQTSCDGYTLVSSTPIMTKTYYNSGTTYTSCPSGYTSEATGTTTCTKWSSPSPITYYLNSSGYQTTNINEAGYFTDAEFAALGNRGTGYSKTSSYVTNWNGTSTIGSCPSGTNSTNCRSVTMYQGKVYGWRWYKLTSGAKEYYNDGEYLAKSPGSGWEMDKSTARWGEWSEFGDTKLTATTTREVKTQKLIRIRKSYIDPNTLKLEEWLPLVEFEAKVGKTLEELKKDSKIKIQTKIMYRYRTLK